MAVEDVDILRARQGEEYILLKLTILCVAGVNVELLPHSS